MKKHKELQNYLNRHPGVREELTENPSYFMNRENRYEASAMDRSRDIRDADRDHQPRDRDRDARDVDRDRARTSNDRDVARSNARNVDADVSKKDLQQTAEFLDKHKKINKDLAKDPIIN